MLGIPSFSGGVHPDELKLTAGKSIERIELPERVVLPLRQNVGAICDPLVEEGDHVKVGQKIGDSDSDFCSPIHASVSGEVVGISPEPSPVGEKLESVIIESDGEDEWVDTEGIDPEDSSKEDILSKIHEGGVVGLGGAMFPSHIKLNPPEEKTVDTVLINGAECEPFLTSDHQLMLERGEEILKGVEVIERVLEEEELRTVIAVEDNKPDALEIFRELTAEKFEWMDVVSVKTKYPQGDERHLIKAILDREVPAGGLPFDVGVIVQNVGTTKAIYDSVCEGVPLVERVVTVSGDVQEPRNVWSRFGTPFSHLIEQCGGAEEDVRKIISGGPLMGVAQGSDVPVIKGTNGILVFNEDRVEEEKELPCIKCDRCVDACPMNLLPNKLLRLVRSEEWDAAEEYNIMSCDHCGSCAYVCPSKIPLVQVIREGQEHIRSRGD